MKIVKYFAFETVLSELGTRFFEGFALALSRSWGKLFALALSRSFFGLKFRAFAFALSRSRAPQFFALLDFSHSFTRSSIFSARNFVLVHLFTGQDRTPRTGQTELDSQNRSARTGQREKDSKNGTGRTRLP